MIVLINGPFGVGKTTVANELSYTIPESHIFDPEELGRPALEVTKGILSPEEATDDFQDIRLWEALLIDTALRLREIYSKSLIIPMTFDNYERLMRVRKALSEIDRTYHFCLTAPIEIIEERLAVRGEDNGEWPRRRARECCVRQKGIQFEKYIDTSRISASEVAIKISEEIKTQKENI